MIGTKKNRKSSFAFDLHHLDRGNARGSDRRCYWFRIPAHEWIDSRRRAGQCGNFRRQRNLRGMPPAEAELWRGSQHKAAMQHATDKTVLGDFRDASFDYFGVHSRFFRRDGKFMVETDGPDGKLAAFEVKYTFGIDPLQQYLVEFPDGRLQALSLAWDSRPKDKGGQRWFHLYPDEEIKHDDVLHWTKLNQNWNFMCAECHSTGVRKNYDAATDRFATTWPRSASAARPVTARARTMSPGRTTGRAGGRSASARIRPRDCWSVSTSAPTSPGGTIRRPATPQRNFTPALLRKEVETCGLATRAAASFSEDWVPGRWLSDTHVVAPLTRGLYRCRRADARLRVYNYGSFKQSKMFAAGVTCSDCHEPHSAKLRAPGDGVCLQCHAPDKYAPPAHTPS